MTPQKTKKYDTRYIGLVTTHSHTYRTRQWRDVDSARAEMHMICAVLDPAHIVSRTIRAVSVYPR